MTNSKTIQARAHIVMYGTILSLLKPFLVYSRHQDQNRKAKSSIIKYKDCLRNIVKRIGNLKVTDINDAALVKLSERLEAEGISPRRQASLMNTLRTFFKYCEKVGLKVIDRSEIPSPKLPKPVPEYLTDEEIKRFIEAIKLTNNDGSTNIPGLRFRALIELILSTGMRVSETLSIKIRDIDFQEKEVVVNGKGEKQRYVYLNDRAIDWLGRYLTERDDNSNEYLFVTRDGKKRLKVHDLWRFSKRYSEQAKINKRVGHHVFRRTYATKMLENGADLKTVSELLGHSDVTITSRYYIGPSKKRNKDAHKKFLKYDI